MCAIQEGIQQPGPAIVAVGRCAATLTGGCGRRRRLTRCLCNPEGLAAANRQQPRQLLGRGGLHR